MYQTLLDERGCCKAVLLQLDVHASTAAGDAISDQGTAAATYMLSSLALLFP